MDYGIKISDTETDVLDADLEHLLLTTEYPFAKLDTSNDVSFRNIFVRFNTNPPNPGGAFPDTDRETTVYTFAHGYDYAPATWALIQTVSPAVGATFYQSIAQDSGVISAIGVDTSATLTVKADDENINLVVNKYFDNFLGGSAINIVGVTVRIRLFVFVESLA